MSNAATAVVESSGDHQSGAELSIVVPTFNERDNVPLLVEKIEAILQGIRWELIFVDDNSPDGTAVQARKIAQVDRRVRCIQRIGRRGLSSACVEGFLASSAPYLAVMDGDLQHDEAILPDMFKAVNQDGYDLAVGSRYVEGGGFGSWEESRIKKSQLATKVSNFVTKADLSDPMSGFFLFRREVFENALPNLSSIGFKILLDMFVSYDGKLKFKEVPFQFRERSLGESKLDTSVMWDYFMLLADKTVGHIIPVRFFSFALVGGTGVFVHLLVVSICFQMFALSFNWSQGVATFVAMTTNFFINNLITYRDRRLRGVGRLFWGWVTFVLACSIGAFANVGVAGWLHGQDNYWVLSSLAGIAVGTIWNYAVTSLLTWKK